MAKEVSSATAVRHSIGVTETKRHLLDDLQASTPEIPIGLSRAGVTGVQKAVRIGRGEREKLIAATIDCTVDLDPSQKGVHMSRFPELFEEAIEGVVADDAFLIEDLAEHVAGRIVERQQALLAEVHIRARYPYERTTPVTGSQLIVAGRVAPIRSCRSAPRRDRCPRCCRLPPRSTQIVDCRCSCSCRLLPGHPSTTTLQAEAGR